MQAADRAIVAVRWAAAEESKAKEAEAEADNLSDLSDLGWLSGEDDSVRILEADRGRSPRGPRVNPKWIGISIEFSGF